ncbi:four-helix bundle copper-binding protein [Meiothermus luteus]|nr:four-helix bundle copper-binding protein [Meiothermus luteus]
MQACIEACGECHDVCLTTVQHCLQHGGQHVEPAHMTIMMDCVQICETAKDFMLRGSRLHAQVCRACAEVCEACAQSCEAIDDPDGAMRACADACRRCAQECRRMAQAA